jgi:hypothetical protein
MDMQTKTFSYTLLCSYARIVCVWCSIKSIIINPVQVVKVLITQDETTLILDYKLERSIMLVLLIFKLWNPKLNRNKKYY